MRILLHRSRHVPAGGAFSLIEVLVSVAIIGIMFVSLYSGLTTGFAIVQLARENLRATQILQEKMETIRLYNWDQLNTDGFVPTNFTDVFYANSASTNGLIYTGSVVIANYAGTDVSYSNDLKSVTFTVQWKSGNVLRTREMSTLVSRYGLQNYVY